MFRILFLVLIFVFSLQAQATKKTAKETKKEDFELEIEKIESTPVSTRTTSKTQNGTWEDELEKDLKDLERKQKGFEDSRGFASPIQTQNQINRSAQNLMMDVFAALDIVGEYDRNKPRKTKNELDVRTAEFGFSGAVDQWLRGYFLGAAHGEDGKYFFEVHEAWMQFPFLPFNTSLKAGMMFLDIGRINRIHSHDRPFTESPYVHRRFLDWESIFDTGAELSILFPWSFITQELVIGATNGKKWGHAHSAGVRKNNPLMYAHLKNFYYFGDNWGTQFGFTALRFEPTQDKRNERYLYGFDAVLRWNRSNLRELMVMSEVWYNTESFPKEWDIQTNTLNAPPRQTQWGYYFFVNYKFHQLWSAGYRFDYFTDKNIKDANGYNVKNSVTSNVFQITFHTSEFAYVRATYEREFAINYADQNDPEKLDIKYYIQGMIILGSHPPHVY